MMGETLREHLERQMAEPLHLRQPGGHDTLSSTRSHCHMHNKGYLFRDARSRTMPVVCEGHVDGVSRRKS